MEIECDELESTSFHDEILRELNRIEDYYQQAGEKRARLHFVSSRFLRLHPRLAANIVVFAGRKSR